MVSVQVQKSQIPAIKANNSFLIKTNGSLVVLIHLLFLWAAPCSWWSVSRALWNSESWKWCFQGFSRGIFQHGCHVVSSEYRQDWEQYHWNVPGVFHNITWFKHFTNLNLFKYVFNVIQDWETNAKYNFF